MTLTKAAMVARLRAQVGFEAYEAKDFVDRFFETLRDTLASGEMVKLSGFGNFELRDKPGRPGRNPKTGAPAPITARRVVTFHPGSKLRAQIEADPLSAHACKLMTAGMSREHIRRDLARLSGRENLSYRDVAEFTGTEYTPPTMAELHAYGTHEHEQGFSHATIARWWGEAGYPTRSGRGRWHPQTVEKFLTGSAP